VDILSQGLALLRASSVFCLGLWFVLNPADLGQAWSCSGGSGVTAGEGRSWSLLGEGTAGGPQLAGGPLSDPSGGGTELLPVPLCKRCLAVPSRAV